MAAPDRLQRASAELTRAERDASADDTEATLQHACQALEAALKAIIAHEHTRDEPFRPDNGDTITAIYSRYRTPISMPTRISSTN